MRILLIQTLEAEHIFSAFTGSLCAALLAHGVEAEVFDHAAEPNGLGQRLMGGRYDAVISFNSIVATAVLKGRSIYDMIGTKFLGWYCDHPLYLAEHIMRPLAARRSIYPSRNQVRFIEAMGLPGENLVLLPGATAPEGPVKAYADREIDVLIMASRLNMPQRTWEVLEDSPAKRLLTQVVDRLLADRERSALDAFLAAREDLGLQGLKIDDGVIRLLFAALTHVRHLDRLNVIMRMAEAGLPLTICGSGWEGLLGRFGNVRFRPTAPFAQACRLYGEAKVSINLNGGNGGSERALNAMLAGSCVVSDFGHALADAFTDQEIRFHEGDGIADAVADLLEGPGGEAMAARGQAKAAASMVWTHRVGAVLDLLADPQHPPATS